MTRIVFHADPKMLPTQASSARIDVALYSGNLIPDGIGRVGFQLLDLVTRFGVESPIAAFDFLTISLAVVAADTFVKRESGDDGWSRRFELTIPLANPKPWTAAKKKLESTLRFLSGDVWKLTFEPGGRHPPSKAEIARRKRRFDISTVDGVCLFSGGLDSAIGAVELVGKGRKPLLVSHSYVKDGKVQRRVAGKIVADCSHINANANPTGVGVDDDSMRTRSIVFLGVGAVAASALSEYRGGRKIDLFIPENGFIALNAPLTPRRIGSHSTRTAHPHFLQAMQEIWDVAKMPVRLENPYRTETKGEMLARHAKDAELVKGFMATVSCGKWKREDQQCGRCVPCLVRRAAFHAAKIPDKTSYRFDKLREALQDEDDRDDMIAVLSAVRRAASSDADRWLAKAGPLPLVTRERKKLVSVFERGVGELEIFLRSALRK
jgi:7-cyano-7-deazaguanine synthase in queuosine biosynthesis